MEKIFEFWLLLAFSANVFGVFATLVSAKPDVRVGRTINEKESNRTGTDSPTGTSRALHKFLLDNYDMLVRPVKDDSENVTLKFGLTLLKILELDEHHGILRTVTWQHLEWRDWFLQWKPSDFNNITEVHIPPHRIWKPDIYAYNSVDINFDGSYQTPTIVQSNGTVTYVPPGVHLTSCKISYTNFPFDEQKCDIKVGSWTSHGRKIDLVLHSEEGVDISSFTPDTHWALMGAPMKRDAIYYACCPEPYISITAVIHIKRRGETILSQAKTSNAFICFTLFLSFLIPVASGYKISFAILHVANVWYTIWRILSDFPHLMENSTDDGGPLIGYFRIMRIFSEMSLGANVFTVWLFYTTLPMPNWIRKYILEPLNKLTSRTRRPSAGNTSVADGLELIEGKTSEGGTGNSNTRNDWQSVSLFADRCFLVFFTVLALLTWMTSFPSF